jgi:hypothetical protein
LRIAPIVIDPATHTPRVRLSEAPIVADNRMPHVPVFSSNGRWVRSTRNNADPQRTADFFSVAEVVTHQHR